MLSQSRLNKNLDRLTHSRRVERKNPNASGQSGQATARWSSGFSLEVWLKTRQHYKLKLELQRRKKEPFASGAGTCEG
jgi:hypothetical protein